VARPAALIQAQITAIETQMTNMVQSAASDGTSVNYVEYDKLNTILRGLYADLARANGSSPMFVRGVVKGL
jgi:hypothetical protein